MVNHRQRNFFIFIDNNLNLKAPTHKKLSILPFLPRQKCIHSFILSQKHGRKSTYNPGNTRFSFSFFRLPTKGKVGIVCEPHGFCELFASVIVKSSEISVLYVLQGKIYDIHEVDCSSEAHNLPRQNSKSRCHELRCV